MKARVLVPLNIRTGTPEVLPHNNTGDKFFNEGDIVEIEDAVVGETYKEINIWYKLTDGGFVWSGGIDGFFQPSAINAWWLKNALYSVPELWTIPEKRMIKIAILDTGISNHIDLDFSKITGFNYLANTEDYKTDVKGHGTHCAGIIAAQGHKCFGVAPAAHLYVAKVCDDFGIPDIRAIKNALSDIYSENKGTNDLAVINMSFGMIAKNEEEIELKKEIKTLIENISKEKNCLLVASSGSIDDAKDSFPSILPEVISVGCLSSTLLRHPQSRKTPTLDIMAPGENITSLNGQENLATESGTSQAAAFVSGICALMLQKTANVNINVESVKSSMYATAVADSFMPDEYGRGIINPNKIFQALKL